MALSIGDAFRYINPTLAFNTNPVGTARGFARDFGLTVGKLSQQASKTRARILREQWEDYKTRFQPLENILLGYAKDREGYINKAVGGARERVNQAYAGGQGLMTRRLGSYGLSITPEMQQRISQRLGLEKGLAQVQASNMARREANAQLDTIVGGGLTTGVRG